jgi:putative addiction module component (TIGR02574 family)
MPKSLDELEREVLQLPERDRARLAEHLLSSLVPGEDVDAEDQWLDEAERRYQAFREGKIGSRPADQVIKDARKKLA